MNRFLFVFLFALLASSASAASWGTRALAFHGRVAPGEGAFSLAHLICMYRTFNRLLMDTLPDQPAEGGGGGGGGGGGAGSSDPNAVAMHNAQQADERKKEQQMTPPGRQQMMMMMWKWSSVSRWGHWPAPQSLQHPGSPGVGMEGLLHRH